MTNPWFAGTVGLLSLQKLTTKRQRTISLFSRQVKLQSAQVGKKTATEQLCDYYLLPVMKSRPQK